MNNYCALTTRKSHCVEQVPLMIRTLHTRISKNVGKPIWHIHYHIVLVGGKTWKNEEHNLLNWKHLIELWRGQKILHIKETSTWSSYSEVVCTAGAISFSRERKNLETVISIGF